MSAALELVAGLDVAETRVGARRNDADRDERVVLFGDFGASGQARAGTRRVGDRPIGVDGDHGRVGSVAPSDLLSGPGQRGGRSAGARLGDQVRGGYLGQQLADGRHQTVVREYQDSFGWRDRLRAARDRFGEQRLVR